MRSEKEGASVRTVMCYLYNPPSRSWQLPLSARETARKKNLRNAQYYEWNPDSVLALISVQVSLYWSETRLLLPVEFEDCGVVVVIADPTILCLATLESAILVIDGPKMKSSTTLGFLSMLRMKMTRNTSSS